MTTWLQTQISLRRKRRKRNVEYDCANTITIRLPILNVKDNANKVHANSNIGQIKMSNL